MTHADEFVMAIWELPATWNSLEIVKLATSALTPIAALMIGIWINRIAKRFEAIQWASQKIIEKRITIYDELAPLCNDLVCYFTFIGNWKEQLPINVIRLKRDLDKKIHVAAPLFSEKFIEAYYKFINLCFETFTGWGEDAKLRTSPKRRREPLGDKWQQGWDNLFSNEPVEPTKIREAYLGFMCVFSEELGLRLRGGAAAGPGPLG